VKCDQVKGKIGTVLGCEGAFNGISVTIFGKDECRFRPEILFLEELGPLILGCVMEEVEVEVDEVVEVVVEKEEEENTDMDMNESGDESGDESGSDSSEQLWPLLNSLKSSERVGCRVNCRDFIDPITQMYTWDNIGVVTASKNGWCKVLYEGETYYKVSERSERAKYTRDESREMATDEMDTSNF